MIIRTQEIEIKSKISLDEIKLERNKEIEILAEVNSEVQPLQFIRVVNINGKIVVFTDDIENLEVVKWEGHMPYKDKIRRMEDEMEEGE